MLNFLKQITFWGFLSLLLACKVKNPIGKKADPNQPKYAEDGIVTANVISIHNFLQRPYDNSGLRDALSGYSSATIVASDESTYESVGNPDWGCRAYNSVYPDITLHRYLNLREVTITLDSGPSTTFQSKQIGNNPYAFSENIFLPPGTHTISSPGVNAGILSFNTLLNVAAIDPDIQIEIDNGSNARQPIDFPSIGDALGVVEIDRDYDALIHINPPENVDFIRVEIGDQRVSQECYFSPQRTLRIPSATLSKIGSISESSDRGIIHIDFVSRSLVPEGGTHIKRLYIENSVRHTQGFEDFGSIQLHSGILKFL